MSAIESPTRRSLAILALLSLAAPAAAQMDDPYASMRARHIGPAGMSGRVSDVEVVLSDRNIIYVGAATGGVFKSIDGGLTWNPIFDGQNALSIGAVAVFQPNPDVVWVGTGEGNPRNSAGVGRGLFKSIDGGRTWRAMGFTRSERIHRILTHPTNPSVVYVGVLGPAWSDGQERGLYRTRDGGRTWDRVLWQNPRTGVGEVVMDPSNPDKLIAAMWEFRRDPWFLTSGGPGSGIFTTHDGGDSWRQSTADDGLPTGELGRSGLAFSQSNPEVVYALVEAERSALLRSDDGGATWRTVSSGPGVNPRPFYYADIRVDPKNENRIYRLASSIQVAEDQGRQWRTVVPSGIIHGDVHELWIDPDDPRRMILGEDGGIAFTYDRGDNWRFVENLPLAQFYHVTLDDDMPFNIYGGLQDNGSWYGPSTVFENKGVLNAHFRRVGGGDGFTVMTDWQDPDNYGYSMSQGGSLQHFNKNTGARRSIQPVHPDGVELRFNWNAALTWDPLDPGTIYLGSQFVHRSGDQGRSWQIISPDLTTNDPAKQRAYESGGLTPDGSGAEMHTTLIAIAPSPLESGVVWASTDDGNVQITRDASATWTNVRENVEGLPFGIWVPDVQPSVHVPGRAYLVAEDHRRGDWTPHVYVTEDHGETWTSLAGPDIDGFVHAIEEDPQNPNLLFLGTEFGLRVSFDRGSSWHKYTSGVPAVPIRDLKVHARDGDLVLGTHGRALIVLDDIRPLRELAEDPSIRDAAVHAFQPPPAYQVSIAEAIGYRSTGMTMQQGETRTTGALLTFWAAEPGVARIEISDGDGRLVYSRSTGASSGANRWSWNLRPGGDADEEVFPGQMPVFPGTYSVAVSLGGLTSSTTLEVLPDPRDPTDRAGLVAQRDALLEIGALLRAVGEARQELQRASAAVNTVLETLSADDAELRSQGRQLRDELAALDERLFGGRDAVAGPLGRPMGRLSGETDGPSGNTMVMMAHARSAAAAAQAEIATVMAGSVAAYREALRVAGYTPFGVGR